jgi:hypothetical protein
VDSWYDGIAETRGGRVVLHFKGWQHVTTSHSAWCVGEAEGTLPIREQIQVECQTCFQPKLIFSSSQEPRIHFDRHCQQERCCLELRVQPTPNYSLHKSPPSGDNVQHDLAHPLVHGRPRHATRHIARRQRPDTTILLSTSVRPRDKARDGHARRSPVCGMVLGSFCIPVSGRW